MTRFVWHLAGTFVLATTAVASAQVRGSFERTLNISGPLQLDVATGSGNVTLRTGAEGSVEIRADIRARSSWADEVRDIEVNPPIVQDGNIIRVGHLEDRELRRHVKISYELVVPVDTRLESSTGSGSQTIADINGPLDITSGSGSLEIGRIGADVEARTGSGSITIDGVAGDLDVTAGSGSISAEDVAGAIAATSGSGGVELEQTGSGDISVETGSGRIRVAGVNGGLRVHTGSGGIDVEGEIARDWDLHASSGSITIELGGDSGFELDAKTTSGSIDVSHPVTTSGTVSNKRLRGSVHGGGPRLAVRTSSGSIRIR